MNVSIIHPELSWSHGRGAKPHRNGSLSLCHPPLLRLRPAYKSAKRGRGVNARRLGRALDAQSNLSATIQVVGKPYFSPGDTLFYVQLVSQLGLCGCRYIESPPHDKSGADPKIGHAH